MGPKVHFPLLESDAISQSEKNFDTLRLLNVGKRQNCSIEDTVIGLHRFDRDFRDRIHCSYKIIGFGHASEEQHADDILGN